MYEFDLLIENLLLGIVTAEKFGLCEPLISSIENVI